MRIKYTGESALEIIVLRGYIPHVVSRGQEKKNIEKKSKLQSPSMGSRSNPFMDESL
ncbi:hypothetical protein [Clostridium kluyveri]|uniref:hypothetical protein n=1 Tax=Clostridium kluyveri TaxID=1534 RepID=UPI0018DB61E5|nr:hypothetical protein [Clostridium kluyveri]